jgi:DNA-binding transcriptional MerR regulator
MLENVCAHDPLPNSQSGLMGPNANVKGRLNVNGSPAAMRIGELARRSGLSTSRIRFYEAKGLLNVVSRKANGYREYPADAVMIVGIIVGAQRTGFSLDEIKRILPAGLGNWRRGELTGGLRRKIADIEQMEVRLGQSKRQLYALIRKIDDKPDGMSCADNTKRLLKEFVSSGSRSVSRTSKKRGARSREIAAGRP